MAITKKRIYWMTGSECVMVVEGSATPAVDVAQDAILDTLVDITDTRETSMMLLDGRAWVDVSGGTYGGGSGYSCAITLLSKNGSIQDRRSICNLLSNQGADNEGNKNLPDDGTAPTGIVGGMTGMVEGSPLSVACSRMVPQFRMAIITADLTVAPLVQYMVHMRMIVGH
jgi:hypothetical protein